MNVDQQTVYEISKRRSQMNRILRFFTFPKLHIVQFEPKGSEPAITLWSVKKNEGKVFAEALEIEDREQVELFNNQNIGFGLLLKMFFVALFEF